MPQDIYSREVDVGHPFAADAVRVLVPGMTETGMLAQQVSFQYEQAISRLYEVGSAKVYFVAGRPNGQMSIKRIIAAQGFATAFLSKYGNVCNMAGNRITLDASAGGCGLTTSGGLSAAGCVINSVTYSVSTPDLMISEEVNLMIVRLESVS